MCVLIWSRLLLTSLCVSAFELVQTQNFTVHGQWPEMRRAGMTTDVSCVLTIDEPIKNFLLYLESSSQVHMIQVSNQCQSVLLAHLSLPLSLSLCIN